MTGLYNRHSMGEILEKEYACALRYQTDLSCLLVDTDYFKVINDTFGHVFGDLILRKLSACLKRKTRRHDYVFRYGGKEFMTLLPNTGLTKAKKKVRNAMAQC